jgi:hypothetical protein
MERLSRIQGIGKVPSWPIFKAVMAFIDMTVRVGRIATPQLKKKLF